jgi:hypothetical protein
MLNHLLIGKMKPKEYLKSKTILDEQMDARILWYCNHAGAIHISETF